MLQTSYIAPQRIKLGGAAALPLVHIRTGRAAGKLSVGFWDHWVPAGNDVLKQAVRGLGREEQVDVKVDFITSVGNKLLLTQAAEAQAGPATTRCTSRSGRSTTTPTSSCRWTTWCSG